MENDPHPSATPAEPPHPLLGRRMNTAEAALEHTLDHVWHLFRKRPYLGAGLAGGVGLVLASFIGVGELAIGVGAGYAVYQMLRNRVPPAEAVREALRIEQGLEK